MDSKDSKGIDRISSLPDDILCHILSLLRTKYAVATSILSTRWKHLSSLVPNIDVSDYDVGTRNLSHSRRQELVVTASIKFMLFVRKVLMVRALPNIRSIPRFCLHCSIKYDHNILDKCILAVLLLNVRELDLWVKLEESDTLPCEIFKCKSLEVLKLGTGFHLNVPESAVLPNLKALDLQFIEIIDDASIRKLLSSCPVLEYLQLLRCRFKESNIIEIAHPLLKNLLLSHAFDEYYVIFDTPNLQNLLYISNGDLGFLVKNMESLAHAHIAWGSTEKQFQQIEDDDSENLLLNSVQGTTFINEMHKVRSLYLAGSSLNVSLFT